MAVKQYTVAVDVVIGNDFSGQVQCVNFQHSLFFVVKQGIHAGRLNNIKQLTDISCVSGIQKCVEGSIAESVHHCRDWEYICG